MTVVIEQGPIKVVSMGGVVLGLSDEMDLKIMKAQQKFYKRYDQNISQIIGFDLEDVL